MLGKNLLDIIGTSSSMEQAFSYIKVARAELMLVPLGDTYEVLAAREEFCILSDSRGDRKQLLHKYGADKAYQLYFPSD
jgi:hypothetical protein